MQVAVIGAGVIGSSLAFRLAQAGCKVTLIDRSAAGHGTTSSSFAWINASSKEPEDYFALNRAGMQAHRTLRNELGDAPWLTEGGNLVWVSGDAASTELEERVAKVRGWGYAAEWVDRSTMQALEPAVRIEDDIEQGVLFPDEAAIDGPLLARHMTALAVMHGATMRFGTEVSGMLRENNRITGLVFANQDQLHADLIVNCAGPWSDSIAHLAGRRLPLAPTTGLTVRISGAGGQVQRVLHAPRLHMRPDSNGLVMLHHGDADQGISDGDPPARWLDELIARARQYVPAFEGARLSRWAVVTRPIPVDGRTSAGIVPSLPGYAEVVTHSGITLGPLLAQLVTEQIVRGQTNPLLLPFSPERFESGDR